MSRTEQLARLGGLSRLILDVRLGELRRAAQIRDESLVALRALDASPAEGLDPLASVQADLRYQHWADRQRSDINLRLARQTAAWLVARDDARRAFGQAEALDAARARAEKPRRPDGAG